MLVLKTTGPRQTQTKPLQRKHCSVYKLNNRIREIRLSLPDAAEVVCMWRVIVYKNGIRLYGSTQDPDRSVLAGIYHRSYITSRSKQRLVTWRRSSLTGVAKQKLQRWIRPVQKRFI